MTSRSVTVRAFCLAAVLLLVASHAVVVFTCRCSGNSHATWTLGLFPSTQDFGELPAEGDPYQPLYYCFTSCLVNSSQAGLNNSFF